MKFLAVIPHLDNVTGGGATERTVQFVQSLSLKGHTCKIIATDLRLSSERKKNLSEKSELILARCLNARYYVPAIKPRVILNAVRECDVVHIMGHWSLINVLVYWATRLLHKPYVFSPVGSLPIVGHSKILKKIYNQLVGRAIVANAAGHIAVTEKELLDFIPYGIDPKKIKVIPNGIRTELLTFEDTPAFRQKMGAPKGKIFLYVGRLNAIKGPDMLIEAFIKAQTKLKDDVLLIAGPDEGLGPGLRQRVIDAGLTSRIHFIGYLDAKAKSQAYHACDVLVIPSRSEAMSIVAVEGGFCGLPTLLTDVCGFDTVDEVHGGKTVPATVEGLFGGLIYMKEHESELAQMGARLKERVIRDFTWDHVTDELIRYVETEIL